jgi:hypothetical protein
MVRHTYGWFGALSAAGFLILSLLYVADLFLADVWAFSATWTLIVALVAGAGAAALYFGNDPTNDATTTGNASH